MSDEKQQDQPKLPEIEVTKECSDAEKYKNEANDYFKSMHNIFLNCIVCRMTSFTNWFSFVDSAKATAMATDKHNLIFSFVRRPCPKNIVVCGNIMKYVWYLIGIRQNDF